MEAAIFSPCVWTPRTGGSPRAPGLSFVWKQRIKGVWYFTRCSFKATGGAAHSETDHRPTCVCGTFWNGRTCMSIPSTATRCPCLGSAVSGLYALRLLPADRPLLPVGSCARRWIWWREPGAAWAGQPCSWGNLSWRPRREEAGEGREGRRLQRGGEEEQGWERMMGRRVTAEESWGGRDLEESQSSGSRRCWESWKQANQLHVSLFSLLASINNQLLYFF